MIPEGFPPYAVKEELAARQTAKTTEKSRGRIETRTITNTTNVIDEGYLHWPGVKQIIRLERRTTIKGMVRNTTTFANTSLSRDKAEAAFLLYPARSKMRCSASRVYT